MDESFVHEVRSALNHLYDWVTLRENALVSLFGLQHRENPSGALNRILAEAIESLKPGADVPAKTRAWRTYRLLSARFFEQLTQAETALDLGLSLRQIRREEAMAIQAVAEYLWYHHQLEGRWQQAAKEPTPAGGAGPAEQLQTPTLNDELAWLQHSLPTEPVEVEALIQDIMPLVSGTLRAADVRLEYKLPPSIPLVLAQPTTLRQALLTLLTVAIRSAPHGDLDIVAESDETNVTIQISSTPQGEPPAPTEGTERLDMARRIVELSGGTLHIAPSTSGREPFLAKITLLAAEHIPVLIVEDNLDTLHLMERHLAKTRYRFVGVTDPRHALDVAAASSPQIIVMDVMLPHIDGWDLLGRLHEHPQTHGTPIVVCSILAEEQLALDLGAAAFIRKPVSREGLLSTLDRCGRRPATESG